VSNPEQSQTSFLFHLGAISRRYLRPPLSAAARTLRYSFLYNQYQRVFRPYDWMLRQWEARFYRQLFALMGKRHPLVLDVGAHQGYKADAFLRAGARVVSFEPDADSFAILRTTLGRRSNIQLVNQAMSNVAGTSTFFVQKEGSVLNTLEPRWKDEVERPAGASAHSHGTAFAKSYEVETTTLAAAVRAFGKPDYIKIDVEGHERLVIEGLDEPVAMLSFECNLPIFLGDTVDSIRTLAEKMPGARFNFSQSPLVFKFEEWLTEKEAVDFISASEQGYFEIFCRST
jgi:FkbM family methyltransferase